MNALQFTAGGGVLLAAAIGVLWLRSDHAPPSKPSGPPPAASAAQPQRLPFVSAVSAEPTKPKAAHDSPSPPTAPRDPTVDLAHRAAEAAYRRAGAPHVDYLVSRGLSRPDSELVVKKAVHDATGCSFDALRVEAEQQVVSFDALLDATEAILYDADGPALEALIDMRAVHSRAAPCVLNVVQQAGLPFSWAEPLSR